MFLYIDMWWSRPYAAESKLQKYQQENKECHWQVSQHHKMDGNTFSQAQEKLPIYTVSDNALSGTVQASVPVYLRYP